MGGSDIEHNKYVGQASTILRALTSKDGVFLSHFDKIDESQAQIQNTSLKHLLINNHDVPANKGKIKGQLTQGHKFGLVEPLKRLLNN